MTKAWPRVDRAGLAMLVGLATASALVRLAHPWGPYDSDFSSSTSLDLAHPLGLDPLHRDLLARLAAGAVSSLALGLGATASSALAGCVVGLSLALAERGSRPARLADRLATRVLDVLLALPFLVVASAAAALAPAPSFATVFAVLAGTGWVGLARVVREKARELLDSGWAEASRGLGGSSLHVAARHLAPNVAPLVASYATGLASSMILAEAALGYLGLGVPPPAASWGRMIREAEGFAGTRPALLLLPAGCIVVVVVALDRLATRLGGRAPRSRLDSAIAFTALLAFLALPTPPAPAPSPALVAAPRRGGTLRLASYAAAPSLDPATAYDEAAVFLQRQVFATLVTLAPDGTVVPYLAERVNLLPDGKTYRASLREGLRFHDESPVSAADVKRSLERCLRRASDCPVAHLFRGVVGFGAFHDGDAPSLDGVRAIDAVTVEIELSAPDPAFWSLLALPASAPVCPTAGPVARRSDGWMPCGAGPFRLVEWDPERRVRLERHPAFHVPDRPYLDAIEWTPGVRVQAQRFRFEQGTLDVLREWSTAGLETYGRDPRWAELRRVARRDVTNAVFLNTAVAPFDRVEVRRAVALALDPSVLPSIRPDVVPLTRTVPPGFPLAGDEPLRRHDLAAARDLLARAGIPFDARTGKGGVDLDVDYLVPVSFEQYAAEVFARQLAEIGLRVRLRVVSLAAYQAEVGRAGAAAMGWAGWGADYADPSTFFEGVLTSSGVTPEGSTNPAFLQDGELDELVARARRELDPSARRRLYDLAQRRVAELAAWIPTHTSGALEVRHPHVRGWPTEPQPPLTDVWLAPIAHDGAAAEGSLP